MDVFSRRLAKAMLLTLCVGSFANVAFAGKVLVDTLGFETFTNGALTPVATPGVPQLGQQGWVGIDHLGGTSNVVAGATVQSGVVNGGSKALQVDRAANVDNRWSVLFGASSSPTTLALTLPANRISLPSTRFILIDWDMRVMDSGGDGLNGVLGPFMGVEAYDSSGSAVGLLGSLGVDASTGEVLYQVPGTGFLEAAGPLVGFEEWNRYTMLLDYAMDKYSIYLNGALLKTTTFVDNSNIVGGLNRFTDADISAIAAAANSASMALPGTAHFDNFKIYDGIPGDYDSDGDVDTLDLTTWRASYGLNAGGDADGDGDTDGNDFILLQRFARDFVPAVAAASAVPEPAALTLLALAGLAGLRRRRRA